MPYTPNEHQKDKDSGSRATLTIIVLKLGQVIYGTTASSVKTIKMGLNLQHTEILIMLNNSILRPPGWSIIEIKRGVYRLLEIFSY